MKIISLIAKKSFTIFSVLLALSVATLFYLKVDLSPQVSPDFFFETDSKIFQQDLRIKKSYPSDDHKLLIALPNKNLLDERYIKNVKDISDSILNLKGTVNVFSLTHGPPNPEKGIGNPFWKRLLTGNKSTNSFIIASLTKENQSQTIDKIEAIITPYNQKGANINIAGPPYFVDQIKHSLKSDMKTFTLAAIILCSLFLLIVYRSLPLVLLGIFTCLVATAMTITINSLLGYGIGVLTANLLVITYILTQSHFVFLSSNYKKIGELTKATSKTLSASFWCMLTTLMGFVALISVEAKPLSDLGVGGVIATLCALISCYLIAPAFLNLIKLKNKKSKNQNNELFFSQKIRLAVTSIFFLSAIIIGVVGIPQIDTDPSLLKYFPPDEGSGKQFAFVNRRGGSNPLKLELSRKDNQRLDTKESHQKMIQLHQEFMEHGLVGSIISLPYLMSEVDEHWLGRFLSWKATVSMLESDSMKNIANAFISKDRKKTLFTLKMIETRELTVNRLVAIEDLRVIASKNGFNLDSVGGTYFLQGELADLVKKSLVEGLVLLFIVFTVIIFFISHSLLLSLIVGVVSVSLCALIYGCLGLIGTPIDIISSTSMSVAMGIAVDNFIHLIRSTKEDGGFLSKNWRQGLKDQIEPIMISVFTIAVGFSVFFVSGFAPSQRFGGIIMFGSILVFPVAVFLIPYLMSSLNKKNPLK